MHAVMLLVPLLFNHGLVTPEIYHGRENRITVRVPRLAQEARVDGRLDEPMWAEAALLTGFSQYRPVDGLAADDSTEILVWYAEHEIYFGIRAFEPHGLTNATLANRDRIDSDDHVQLLLDTFNDRRRALVFGVNPLGVQADGILTEGENQGRVDLSPDFVFESRGRVTESGWEAEIRIPFKSLRYQSERVQTWGLNIVRRVQHSGHTQTWTAARQGQNSFLGQSGTLVDLTELRRGLVLDVNPVVTARADGTRNAQGDWRYGRSTPELGANLRWGMTENLTANLTANPDFSQVESDAGQLSFDPRSALFFPEKRPFFLEASENFSTPNQLIHTRRITSPVVAAKFTGRLSNTNIGLLTAVDDDALSATGDHPLYNLLRLRRDIGGSSTVGMVYTDRIEGTAYNRVVAADTRLVFGGLYSFLGQIGASFTQTANATTSWRPIFELGAARRGRHFGVGGTFEGSHHEFRAASGFVSRPGIVHAQIRPTYTLYGQPGAAIASFTATVNLDGTWTYDRFMHGNVPDDQKLHTGGEFVFRGGWRLGTQFLLESFKYPPELYRNYWIDAGTDTVPFVGTDRIANYDLLVTFGTPQFPKFSADLFTIFGRDENFFEWAPSWVALATVNASYRPTEKLRASGQYVIQRYARTSDNSVVGMRQIPRVKLEYQLSRPIFIRLVGEYDADQQDDLRDDSRTGLPILLCSAGPPNCEPARGYRRGRFRADWLFSYQPTPGTVLFAGYGSTLDSGVSWNLGEMRRANDGFFLKLSYLLRM
jgi:hypothetical protein